MSAYKLASGLAIAFIVSIPTFASDCHYLGIVHQ